MAPSSRRQNSLTTVACLPVHVHGDPGPAAGAPAADRQTHIHTHCLTHTSITCSPFPSHSDAPSLPPLSDSHMHSCMHACTSQRSQEDRHARGITVSLFINQSHIGSGMYVVWDPPAPSYSNGRRTKSTILGRLSRHMWQVQGGRGRRAGAGGQGQGGRRRQAGEGAQAQAGRGRGAGAGGQGGVRGIGVSVCEQPGAGQGVLGCT